MSSCLPHSDLLLSAASREPFSHTISKKRYRPAPEPNWDVRKIFPFTTSRSPLRNLCENNFPKHFHQKFFPELSQKTFPAHATIARFAIFKNAASHLSPDSCIQSPRHTADPESKLVSASPPLSIYLPAPLFIHNQNVYRDFQGFQVSPDTAD